MNIAVVGTGYVGLVTGTCLAETGNNVTCVDIDLEKVEKLNQGIIPIYEPGLDTLFYRNVAQKRLRFTSSLEEGLKGASIIFLALPTPPGEDGSADLSYVLEAAEDIGKLLKGYTIIIDKSTVPVGTADKVQQRISQFATADFDVVSNPEFLREGVAVDDFMKPDRIVIGTSSETVKKILSELYAPYVRQGNPVIFMDVRSAELTKYAANSFLATKISFMNEIAHMCERLGANVDMVRLGIGADDRIGKRFLFPGIGYGGSCFPKDVKALARSAVECDYEFRILEAVMEVNAFQREYFVSKLLRFYHNGLQGKRIAIWGLAFKPETDDIREAPAIYVIRELLAQGASLAVYDPEAMGNIKALFGDKISYAADQYEAVRQADALAILTEWPVFRAPDFGVLKNSLKESVIFDGRNLYDPEKMAGLGFYYNSVGRALTDGRKN
ncbi:UDP-glucose dehydrogenase [Anseongella ginsenosidimutans]|uniref:UDP-glucose 6-dehydrogenase n=1 Tax=Anseongella ginsenosidimutans TaxID=496056 RepID=A0A4R3KPF9_9SPHI|nr:UDP-glucose/GDP-mannose dehydrogenase family protein [Anseongella ginsenosidimutans]QEC54077.1 UDP-glucose/GDP-mannose dehydrogenase family protein [Anseongella ginsenosidimutans]TCS85157.1 UDP-glucose dehydrogenase [Anseongella ginsenosidimutans]